MYQCPYPDCPNRVEIDNNSKLLFACIKCTTTSCIKCKKFPFHHNYTCEEYEQHKNEIEKKK